MVLGILALVGWASVAEIDQVTRTQATIIAAARTQLVQSPEAALSPSCTSRKAMPSRPANSW
jgi:adhesin transport system membrane fusion protein